MRLYVKHWDCSMEAIGDDPAWVSAQQRGFYEMVRARYFPTPEPAPVVWASRTQPRATCPYCNRSVALASTGYTYRHNCDEGKRRRVFIEKGSR